LWSLEEYAQRRPEFRAEVIAHKKPRRVILGPHATLIFEDFLTMKYQVQEMLRVERIFEAAGIEEELAAYNPLIPDGSNWKATLQIEYPDVAERQSALARMPGVEHKVWAEVDGHDRVYAIANEDLDRSTEDKTAAVHFLRFELPAAAIDALRQGAGLRFGIDHPELPYVVTAAEETRGSLLQDFA
jgi:hypothetical protein